ncbi:hypothetical protein RhiJN_06682 [Ceratobasidium sp. AG-Ba]|nr:hypothetical protein RhiJN_06682 [Ceratobasidium sp. AG-Ba]QRW07586.1 hypothetical protein RhiLY_06585 [Ceratobasidium sp. AG-Ba]
MSSTSSDDELNSVERTHPLRSASYPASSSTKIVSRSPASPIILASKENGSSSPTGMMPQSTSEPDQDNTSVQNSNNYDGHLPVHIAPISSALNPMEEEGNTTEQGQGPAQPPVPAATPIIAASLTITTSPLIGSLLGLSGISFEGELEV